MLSLDADSKGSARGFKMPLKNKKMAKMANFNGIEVAALH